MSNPVAAPIALYSYSLQLHSMMQEYKLIVEDYLKGCVPTSPRSLYLPVEYVLAAGGKRFRPVLTMICAGAAGGSPVKAVGCAAAIEILHNFTLVHDDIMDKSALRRGNTTVHTRWNDATAILSGDSMMGLAYKILLQNSSMHPRCQAILAAFTNGLTEVCEGQALDMELQAADSATMYEYMYMIERKTARLLEMAAVIGALFAEAPASVAEALRKYAHYLGMAFQIQDDLLDICARQEDLGKPIGQDIAEGKKTYLIIKALEKADKREHRLLLDEFISHKGLPKRRIAEMLRLFEAYDILDDARAEIHILLEKARLCLHSLPDTSCRQALYGLIDTIESRKH